MNTTTTGSELLSSQGCVSAIRAVGCALLAIFLSVLPVSATTVSYQQDVGGYTGTEDTFLQSDPTNAGTNNGASAFVGWDDDDPGGTGFDVFSLLRFMIRFPPALPGTWGMKWACLAVLSRRWRFWAHLMRYC